MVQPDQEEQLPIVILHFFPLTFNTELQSSQCLFRKGILNTAIEAVNGSYSSLFFRPLQEEISSPFGAQLLEFCESDLFPETVQDSEVASTSNCCYEEQSSYPTNHDSFNNSDMNTYNTFMHSGMKTDIASAATATTPSTSPSTPTITTTRDDCVSIIFGSTDDQIENDISDSIDFTTLSPSFPVYPYSQHTSNQEQFGISCIGNQFSLDMMDGSPHTVHQCIPERQQGMVPPPPGVVPMMGPQIPAAYEGEYGMPSVPSYLSLRSSLPGCSLIDPMMGQYLHSSGINAPFSAENSGIFTGNGSFIGADLSHQELEFQGENGGIFMPDSMPRFFNYSYESQHLDVHGGPNTTPLTSEISSLEDPNFKVGKLSVEERKRKIHRYMKKRNERNFSKKIKYACRKTLADSRPRVRGRFARNDELGDIGRSGGSSHEDDKDEEFSLFSTQIPADQQRKVVAREEDDIDSADILAHISGVNSFKWYPIQSWI
ncbi:hypothetical protein F511_02793 [Dorcoceras hygrometricum]|uniref:CCT domain-containing protein n=1 Tax=Dorcoceras hygrometricum TaxID=472368 RepID=A0A2Z7BIC2_9LAMI|nr:hypothetical protein F511_02793 [Dorcoceras hygrometricum]